MIEHIEKLLTKHDCVILPGLGGFVTHRESAKIIGNTIYPPQMVVSFNALLSHTDGLLAEAIMQENSVDYRTATQLITTNIETIKDQLATKQMFQVGQIGTLYCSASGQLSFIPSSARFLPENMGLEPIVLKPLVKRSATPRTITIELPPYSKQVWKYAAAILCLCILTLIAPQTTNIHNNKAAFQIPCYNNNLFETPKPQPVACDTLTSIQTTRVDTTHHEMTPAKQQAIMRYHLVVASMPTRQAAELYCKEHANSTTPLNIISKNGKHRIIMASFASNTEAFQALDSIRANNQEQRKTWILKATLN